MITKSIWQRSILTMLFLLSVSVSLLVINFPPINNGPFLGDDLLAWNAHNEGNYASDIQESLRYAIGEKWRPVNTTLMIPTLNILGDSYRNFYQFSTALLVILLFALWMTARTLTRRNSNTSTAAVLLGVVVIGSSPFTFFMRSGVYGLLEIAPVIICLLSFSVYQQGKLRRSRRLLVYSTLMALIAGLIHERFFMFSIALALIIAFQARTITEWRGFWLAPLGNILFYVYTAVIVLEVNVFKGGGEVSLNESRGLWIIPRLMFAVIHTFGGAGGEPVFFDPVQPAGFQSGMAFGDNFSLWLPATILLAVMSITWAFLRQRPNNCQPGVESRFLSSCMIESLVIAFALLIPAATVVTRIEARWLFAPFVFFVFALIIMPTSIFSISRFGQFIILGLLILANQKSQNSYKEFDWWRVRSEMVLNVVRSNEPQSGEWGVKVVFPDSKDPNSVVKWGLGDGSAFLSLDNAPSQIFVGSSDETINCASPCLVIEVSEKGTKQFDFRKFEFQTIQTSWR